MYRFLLILLSVVGMATDTGAQQRQDMNKGGLNHKILVAYFSATGTTARAAENWRMLRAESFMRLCLHNPIQVPTSTGMTSGRAVR